MTLVGVAAVGIGQRLQHILDLLVEQGRDQVKIVAVADEAESVAATTGSKYSCPFFASIESLLASVGDSVQWIGSMNHLHAHQCKVAFGAGKHVFCEKPIAISIEQLLDIQAAQRSAGVKFATGFVLRHAKVYVEVQRLINSGAIGKIVSIEANEILDPDHGSYIFRNWRRHQELTGGHLLEKCCHDIDLLNWMVGSVPTRVASFGSKAIFIPENATVADKLIEESDPTMPKLYYGWEDRTWEKEAHPFTTPSSIVDNQVCILEYRNGVHVTFHANCCGAWPQRRMYVLGLEGALEADMWTGVIYVKRVSRGKEREVIDVNVHNSGHGGGDTFLVNDLIVAMTTEAGPKATGQEGLLSAVSCIALEEAMQKRQVIDVEPYWKQFGV